MLLCLQNKTERILYNFFFSERDITVWYENCFNKIGHVYLITQLITSPCGDSAGLLWSDVEGSVV